jgi:predicted TPR repeat methyltransferase
MPASKWLDQVYAARNKRDLAAAYDGWSQEYEKDVSSLGYALPAAMCGMVGRHVSRLDAKILDAGAGTGILGRALALLGYTQLEGIDISEKMLERARTEGHYRSLRQMVLGEPLDLPSQHFDVVTSMGVFTEGHAPPEGLFELARITKPGGFLIFTGRAEPHLRDPLFAVLASLEQQGKLRRIDTTPPFSSMPLGEPWVLNQIHVFRAQ